MDTYGIGGEVVSKPNRSIVDEANTDRDFSAHHSKSKASVVEILYRYIIQRPNDMVTNAVWEELCTACGIRSSPMVQLDEDN